MSSQPLRSAHYLAGTFLVAAVLLLSGCGNKSPNDALAQRAMAVERGEECHLCGMIIEGRPGPKGQLYERGEAQVRKFCSTRDLFAYLLDPEHSHRVQSVFVHNMAVPSWEHPTNDTYIDARKAWYVVDSSRRGAMGPTLASFAKQADAQAFVERYGGRLYRFDAINQALLSQMKF